MSILSTSLSPGTSCQLLLTPMLQGLRSGSPISLTMGLIPVLANFSMSGLISHVFRYMQSLCGSVVEKILGFYYHYLIHHFENKKITVLYYLRHFLLQLKNPILYCKQWSNNFKQCTCSLHFLCITKSKCS